MKIEPLTPKARAVVSAVADRAPRPDEATIATVWALLAPEDAVRTTVALRSAA